MLTTLYWQELRIDPQVPEAPDRDRFVLSKGHGAPVLFQVLAERGFFPIERLAEFGNLAVYFTSTPPNLATSPAWRQPPVLWVTVLPMALGMAIAQRIQRSNSRCYALVSDGECNEGSIWEAAMFAAGQQVHQLTAIVDYNKWQATGRSQEVMALEPLAAKWEAFGWHTQEIDGHDFEAIGQAFTAARAETSKPSVIVAHTIKGKGVSFMEDDNNWHYRTPNPDELAAALAELKRCSCEKCLCPCDD